MYVVTKQSKNINGGLTMEQQAKQEWNYSRALELELIEEVEQANFYMRSDHDFINEIVEPIAQYISSLDNFYLVDVEQHAYDNIQFVIIDNKFFDYENDKVLSGAVEHSLTINLMEESDFDFWKDGNACRCYLSISRNEEAKTALKSINKFLEAILK
jgi:hypothetical protein